ncbi:hypothetical protein [Methylorubrum aminovorans]|uniref:hypothetical protein n=1 Tax=Methylorubrum aminovorans TaxID=269069 RepID=UPI001EDCD48E|nr:hypothetical protein [Methylorubrum aminovorans]
MTHAEKDRLITTLQDAFDLARENQALKETITRKDAEITRLRAAQPPTSDPPRDIRSMMAKIKEAGKTD